MHNVSGELNLLNGAVRRVYTIEGRPIKSLEDIHESGVYVATAGEMFKKAVYDLNKMEETTFTSPAIRQKFNEDGKKHVKETPIFGPTVRILLIILMF